MIFLTSFSCAFYPSRPLAGSLYLFVPTFEIGRLGNWSMVGVSFVQRERILYVLFSSVQCICMCVCVKISVFVSSCVLIMFVKHCHCLVIFLIRLLYISSSSKKNTIKINKKTSIKQKQYHKLN